MFKLVITFRTTDNSIVGAALLENSNLPTEAEFASRRDYLDTLSDMDLCIVELSTFSDVSKLLNDYEHAVLTKEGSDYSIDVSGCSLEDTARVIPAEDVMHKERPAFARAAVASSFGSL